MKKIILFICALQSIAAEKITTVDNTDVKSTDGPSVTSDGGTNVFSYSTPVSYSVTYSAPVNYSVSYSSPISYSTNQVVSYSAPVSYSHVSYSTVSYS